MAQQFIALTCLKCGGKLQIREDKTEFNCPYCGTTHLFNAGDGMLSIAQIAKSIKNVEKGVDKTAAELALKRLSDELASMPYGGNINQYKNALWKKSGDLREELMRSQLKECVNAILKKQNPNRKVSGFKKIFVGEFTDNEMRNKFFSPLTDEELKEMINYCENNRAGDNYYSDTFFLLRKRLMNILEIYEIIREIDKNIKIVKSI